MLAVRKAIKALLPAAAMAAALAACSPPVPEPPENRVALGLMTSLPIFWTGGDAFKELDGAASEPHWAKTRLEFGYRLEPLDVLLPDRLSKLDVLVLGQPRALSPEENVALDDWVRAGGRVLVFADPQLVGEYPYSFGDPRRPIDSILLSPILTRWGLELTQAEPDVRTLPLGDAKMAVAAAGAWRLLPSEDAPCKLSLEQVLATCTIGAGRVGLLADATLLEDPVGGEGSPEALDTLLGMVRDGIGENAGEAPK